MRIMIGIFEIPCSKSCHSCRRILHPTIAIGPKVRRHQQSLAIGLSARSSTGVPITPEAILERLLALDLERA
jgi:hypothetical protein